MSDCGEQVLREYRLRFSVRLITDGVLGSGLGIGSRVDNALSRDHEGRPVLWWHGVKALLRDAADAYRVNLLQNRPQDVPDFDQRVLHLFGREGRSDRGELMGRAWRFSHKRFVDPTMVITNASRPVHSRAPLAKTLRSTEVVRSGSTADGHLRFSGTDEHDELIRQLLRRVESVGSGKSRGLGRILVSAVTDVEPPTPPRPDQNEPSTEDETVWPRKLRVVFQNLEPLLLVDGANSTNIMSTQKFINGASCRGALLNASNRISVPAPEDETAAQSSEADHIVRECRFRNAYPIPSDLADKVINGSLSGHDVLVMPAPQTLEIQKATTVTANKNLPWWADADAPTPALRERPGPDVGDENDQSSFKRIREEMFLAFASESELQLFEPKTFVQLRNRVPSPRMHRDFDSRSATPKNPQQQSALFSQESLVEDQFFVAEIGSENVEVFRQVSRLIKDLRSTDTWLRVGRGGSPVKIVHHEFAAPSGPTPDTGEGNGNPVSQLSVFVQSDMILRGSDLGFYPTLSPDVLVDLGVIEEAESQRIRLAPPPASAVETVQVSGFVGNVGKRRRSELAIKRGSVFRFTGAQEAIEKLATSLNSIRHRGLGMRLQEGYGQFLLDPLRTHPSICLHSAPAGKPARTEIAQETRNREAIRFVDQLRASLTETSRQRQPSRTQWQSLLRRVKSLPPETSIQVVFDELERRSQERAWDCWLVKCHSGEQSHPLHNALKREALKREADAGSDPKEFIVAVARLVIGWLDSESCSKD